MTECLPTQALLRYWGLKKQLMPFAYLTLSMCSLTHQPRCVVMAKTKKESYLIPFPKELSQPILMTYTTHQLLFPLGHRVLLIMIHTASQSLSFRLYQNTDILFLCKKAIRLLSNRQHIPIHENKRYCTDIAEKTPPSQQRLEDFLTQE